MFQLMLSPTSWTPAFLDHKCVQWHHSNSWFHGFCWPVITTMLLKQATPKKFSTEVCFEFDQSFSIFLTSDTWLQTPKSVGCLMSFYRHCRSAHAWCCHESPHFFFWCHFCIECPSKWKFQQLNIFLCKDCVFNVDPRDLCFVGGLVWVSRNNQDDVCHWQLCGWSSEQSTTHFCFQSPKNLPSSWQKAQHCMAKKGCFLVHKCIDEIECWRHKNISVSGMTCTVVSWSSRSQSWNWKPSTSCGSITICESHSKNLVGKEILNDSMSKICSKNHSFAFLFGGTALAPLHW